MVESDLHASGMDRHTAIGDKCYHNHDSDCDQALQDLPSPRMHAYTQWTHQSNIDSVPPTE
ncbi:unnamed protein product [Ectocarpus sp. CCAP 1310/34]|nr:unnamed protein product [Ectocarpus sp. CCAP 1310/34]